MCDMCGKEEQMYRIEIEGSKLNVCKHCAKYGSIISQLKKEQKKQKKRKEVNDIREEEPNKQIIYMVMGDFAKKIRKAREMLGLNQEDFAKKLSEKESVIHKLETGDFKLSLKLARKLEKILGISLIESYEEKEDDFKKERAEEFTIGDIISLKKRK